MFPKSDSLPPETFAELYERIGKVPLCRIRACPAPGTATAKDVIAALEAADKRLYELVEGVLIEKALWLRGSVVAGLIVHRLYGFLDRHDLGLIFGADCAVRIRPGLIRIPDVSFVGWEHLPDGVPNTVLLEVVPDLIVEVIGPAEPRTEIRRKVGDYFRGGTKMVWVVNPQTETAERYRRPDRKQRLDKTGILDGEDLLPGFRLALPELFAALRRRRKARHIRGESS